MTLRRVGLSNSLSTQAKISNKRFTLSRVSLRRFPFPTAAAAAAIPVYIEEVFSTYLYTGTGANTTITNGIDLSTKGGLVWTKARSSSVRSPILFDTVRGAGKRIYSDSTSAETSEPAAVSAFNVNGYNLGADSDVNLNGTTFVSWTFRKQAKFFDVVTYTGNGNNSRQIAHNLGSSPGFVIIKRTDAASDWYTFHRSITSNQYPRLNGTDQDPGYSAVGNPSLGGAVNSTNLVFASAGTTTTVNINNATYVAYIFAHDAGGFGATGSDNVISCGSFTTDGSGNATVNLGYEPQWVMTKRTDAAGNWTIVDVMRGMTVNAGSTGNAGLYADSSTAEIAGVTLSPLPNATGMTYSNVGPSRTFIYIAIRRGPMKTPTSGTNVFSPVLWTGNNSVTRVIATNLSVPDASLLIVRNASGTYFSSAFYDRLRTVPVLATNTTDSESWWAGTAVNMTAFGQGSITLPSNAAQWNSTSGSQTYVGEFFSRAPGFFDVVCYTGTGSATTVTHNLGVAPEIVLVKRRDAAGGWFMYTPTTGATAYLRVDANLASTTFNLWNDTAPTSSVFSLSTNANVNASGSTYVAYLFATVTGVSKVGSYTGTGALQTINCGFAAGARFVLIKRTDSTGDWYVYDSARGISSGNDPYSLLNTQGAEATGTNYVDTTSVGFQVTAAASATINANGGTYIFLAIA